MEPDLAGFRDAQERLRDHFGSIVTMLGDVQVSFPPGTRLDPQTGRPYDPTVQPVASAQVTAVVKANVTYKPMAGDPSKPAAIGWIDTAEVMLSLASAAASAASEANAFLIRGERFQVVANHFDGIADVPDRYLIFGRKA